MTAKPASSQGRLPGIEALRGFAALCILLLHTRAVFGGEPVFGKGYLAVEFFLMLSGFLMAYAQEPRLGAGGPFMIKRYKRLWPTMALGGVIGLPRLWIKSADPGTFLATAAANLALLPAWWAPFAFALNIPAWTIFYELVANTLHVFVLRHLKLWMIGVGIALLAPVMVWIGNMWGNFGAFVSPPLITWVNQNLDVNKDGKEQFIVLSLAFVLSGVSALGIDASRPIAADD